MSRLTKIIILLVLAIAIVAVIVMKKGRASAPSATSNAQRIAGLPRLVDLGSTTCIPCKMMAPILDELSREYAGQLQVVFIDTNTDPDAAKPYGIRLIPTQVFYDASGKELWRHEGFISKQEILDKWSELGVSLAAPPDTTDPAWSSDSPPIQSGST